MSKTHNTAQMACEKRKKQTKLLLHPLTLYTRHLSVEINILLYESCNNLHIKTLAAHETIMQNLEPPKCAKFIYKVHQPALGREKDRIKLIKMMKAEMRKKL